ncbi:MAG TPA: hypothetical protein VM537_07085 [Anaerolineae bacterium]|nr:hypothetical protein [Anaerolineae bacterium]
MRRLTEAALARMRQYGDVIRRGHKAREELPFTQESLNDAHEQAIRKICALIDRDADDRSIARAAWELRAVRGLADRFRLAIESAAIAQRESRETLGG